MSNKQAISELEDRLVEYDQEIDRLIAKAEDTQREIEFLQDRSAAIKEAISVLQAPSDIIRFREQ